MSFAEKLRQLRTRRGLTQTEAAEALGISTRTYKNYELNHTCPRNRKIYARIADFYQIDIDNLLELGNRFIADNVTTTSTISEDEARQAVEQVVMMFAGGSLSPKDKDLALQAIFKAYWDAKADTDPVDITETR